MSRDGSGNYSLPEAAFVAGTTIESAKVNSDLSDIAAALTASLAKDGQTVPTASLPMGGFKLTGLGAGTASGDSARLGQVPAVIRVQTFTSSGTYTPHANMIYCLIEAWGGGGGGGGTAVPGTASVISSGGGGGAGGYSSIFATAATIGASQTVTIGAAGAAGAAGNNAGGAGGDTSVGSICIGKGGSGGGGSNAVGANGGLGGVSGTGTITPPAMAGFPGTVANINSAACVTGGGGSSSVGAGARCRQTQSGSSTTGTAGTGNASGGEGGSTGNGSVAAAGGAGTAGYVAITEFCWA